MSIVIKGIDMPKEPFTGMLILIASNGCIYKNGKYQSNVEAIGLPPHGRLIDADSLIELCNIMAEKCDGNGESIWNQFRTTVECTPTIIEAEEDE